MLGAVRTRVTEGAAFAEMAEVDPGVTRFSSSSPIPLRVSMRTGTWKEPCEKVIASHARCQIPEFFVVGTFFAAGRGRV